MVCEAKVRRQHSYTKLRMHRAESSHADLARGVSRRVIGGL